MSIHGTNPLEGLEEGSSEYLKTKKRLAEEDLVSCEGEIRVTETRIGSTKKFIRHNAGTTLLAVAFAVATGYASYKFFVSEAPADARARTKCETLAKEFQLPATPDSLSLCEQEALGHIQKEDRESKFFGGLFALFSALGTAGAGLRFRECLSDIEELSRKRKELKGYQSKASETREEIKGLDEQLRSFDVK